MEQESDIIAIETDIFLPFVYKAKVYDLLMSDEYGRLDRHPRLLNGIEVLPATEFLRRMWQGDIF